MAILERFSDIISANINALIDKMENPAKMIDQYLRDMMEDLAEVKRSTAGVMAEETRTKRLVDENQAEVTNMERHNLGGHGRTDFLPEHHTDSLLDSHQVCIDQADHCDHDQTAALNQCGRHRAKNSTFHTIIGNFIEPFLDLIAC